MPSTVLLLTGHFQDPPIFGRTGRLERALRPLLEGRSAPSWAQACWPALSDRFLLTRPVATFPHPAHHWGEDCSLHLDLATRCGRAESDTLLSLLIPYSVQAAYFAATLTGAAVTLTGCGPDVAGRPRGQQVTLPRQTFPALPPTPADDVFQLLALTPPPPADPANLPLPLTPALARRLGLADPTCADVQP